MGMKGGGTCTTRMPLRVFGVLMKRPQFGHAPRTEGSASLSTLRVTLIRPREYRTSAGLKVSKQQVTDAMYAPGDGRVTRSSLLGENLIKSRDRVTGFTLSHYAVFGCDLHGQLPRNKSLQDNALTAIVGEVLN